MLDAGSNGASGEPFPRFRSRNLRGGPGNCIDWTEGRANVFCGLGRIWFLGVYRLQNGNVGVRLRGAGWRAEDE